MKKLIAFLLCSLMLFGDSSGPRAGTGSGTSWTNPTNVAAADAAYATYGLGSSTLSNTLSISTLGFAIPAGATITGIAATFKRKCSALTSCSTDTANSGGFWLTKSAGVTQGTNKGTATTWNAVANTETIGSSSELWGSTWTDTEINAAGFGFAVAVYNQSAGVVTASVDYLAITVYYTPSGAATRRRNSVISQTRSIGHHA